MAELGPVIWDVDGTLAATTELGFSATNATLQDAGLSPISREEYEVRTRIIPLWLPAARQPPLLSRAPRCLVAVGRWSAANRIVLGARLPAGWH